MSEVELFDDSCVQLKRLLDRANGGDAAATQKCRRLMTKRQNICSVQGSPKTNWIPKHRGDTLLAIDLIRRGCGFRYTPFTLRLSEPTMKLVTGDVVEAMIYMNPVCHLKHKATVVRLSVVVCSLIARAVEEGQISVTNHEKRHLVGSNDHAIIEKNERYHSPLWASISARGSGVSLNEEGRRFFMDAIVVIEERLTRDVCEE